jgi:MYXO-CTERM domain-containing protein
VGSSGCGCSTGPDAGNVVGLFLLAGLLLRRGRGRGRRAA